MAIHHDMTEQNEKKKKQLTFHEPLYWLVHRDPCVMVYEMIPT